MSGRLAALVLGCVISFGSIAADPDGPWIRTGANGEPEVQLYYFWALSCPHCTAAKPHIEAIAASRPWVRLHSLELSRNPGNVQRFEAMTAGLGDEARSVPALLVCGELYVGWGGEALTGGWLRDRLERCRERAHAGQQGSGGPPRAAAVDLPLLGELDADSISLPLLTLLLASLDAFNPCAFFVLLFLLSLLVHQQHRGRMLLIGGTFVAISGLMYFLFMAAWLNVFQVLGHLSGVTIGAGLLALFIGAVNIKDFFAFRSALTLSIPETGKRRVFRRARTILAADSLPAMLLATVFLAIVANLYELLCTAGFPMVYTRILTLAEPSTVARYLYLAAYNTIYVLPMALILIVFTVTLGARKLTEREGRLLKLLSGIMMLGLGLVLLLAPEWIGRPAVGFGLLVTALLMTWLASKRLGPPKAAR